MALSSNFYKELFKKEKYWTELAQKGLLNIYYLDGKDGIKEFVNYKLSEEERNKFTELLDPGFTDTFRYFYPEETGIYSWWSYRFHAREKNSGWRIDYFLCSKSLESRLTDAGIHTEVFGSDHCPVELNISL